jgi:hypothetical protein
MGDIKGGIQEKKNSLNIGKRLVSTEGVDELRFLHKSKVQFFC